MMELHQPRSDNPAMTFDEVSMERSKSFVKALQELKNLRPQLYSAAEYCEKSYLHSEQKQMVLDNLKDYAVRALVNAVDHLGTVAYKLTDLLEQQTLDVSTMEMKASCLNQQLLTCKTYIDKEGLRQQQLLAFIPRHHKHYILPSKTLHNNLLLVVLMMKRITFFYFLSPVSLLVLHSKLDTVNKKVHFSPHIQTNASQNQIQARLRLQPSGTPASKTLSWHMASETKSTLKGSSNALMSMDDPNTSGKTSGVFNFDTEESARTKQAAPHLQLPTGGPTSSSVMWKDSSESYKPLTAFRSFDKPTGREIVRAPIRSKSMLSAFFVKQKTSKLKTSAVS